MANVLPVGIRAAVDPHDPMYPQFVKFAIKKFGGDAYCHCPLCGEELSEDGMRRNGKLIISSKTCRNPECSMFDWTLNPDEHRHQAEVIYTSRIQKGKQDA